MVLLAMGCSKSDTSAAKSDAAAANSGGSMGSAANTSSALDEQAKAAALAEVQRHWAKRSDGWVTARVSGSAYAPDRYVRQLRDLAVAGVESFELGESDKMNGFEWAGQVTFRSVPCREAGDPGILLDGMSNLGIGAQRRRGRWSQWVDFQPGALHVQKVKGKWQIPPDQWLISGNAPTAQDFANAGVQ
jgi:hypothetical protein